MHSNLDPLCRLCRDNLDLVFFVYGLSFLAMGIFIAAVPKKESNFKLGNILWLLACFALTHGINELLDMWVMIKGAGQIFDFLGSSLLMISYLFLLEFGIRLLSICGQYPFVDRGGRWLRLPEAKPRPCGRLCGFKLTLFAAILVPTFSFFSPDFWNALAVWSRYLLAFPSGILIAMGLILYYEKEKKELFHLKVRKHFLLASVFFLFYSLFGGLVVSKMGFFPADRLNTEAFLAVVHVPVQVFRAFCAIGITWAVYGILRVFSWESLTRIRKEVTEREQAQETLVKAYDNLELRIQERTKELKASNELLRDEVKQRRQAEEENKRNYDIQNVLNTLLNFSLRTFTVEELLEKALYLVLSIPWLGFESKGSIFIAEGEPPVLVMKAQKDLSSFIRESCARLAFGKCICGKAASMKKIQFVDHFDERHEIRYTGITRHGHFCIPIIFSEEVLGVINLYIKEGYAHVQKEEDFMVAVANTLAGVIKRKRAEDELKETQNQLIQAEKLNAVGQLASGVAHEVKNPLGIILQGVNYLENKASGEGVAETLAMLKESVKRADRIVLSLLDFSKATALNLEPQDINSILEVSLSLVRAKIKFENIEVIMDTKKGIARVMVDRNKMEQVFINLFLNAIQAMPQGGRITVRTYEKQLTDTKEPAGMEGADYFRIGEKVVRVEIEDTGIGIPEANLNKVFVPFFTTKGPHEGAGLGLSVSRNIIIMHKGLIGLESKAGKGTRARITLKTAEAEG